MYLNSVLKLESYNTRNNKLTYYKFYIINVQQILYYLDKYWISEINSDISFILLQQLCDQLYNKILIINY